jgi:hypothetical protein
MVRICAKDLDELAEDEAAGQIRQGLKIKRRGSTPRQAGRQAAAAHRKAEWRETSKRAASADTSAGRKGPASTPAAAVQ